MLIDMMLLSVLVVLVVLFLLQTKHLVVDFLYQPPYMYLNKGTLGHPGGLIHAGLHGLVSFVLLYGLFFVVNGHTNPAGPLAAICLAEFAVHYVVDWAKMNINRLAGWTPINSEWFWRLLGVDQYLHQLTYIGMILALLFWY